MPNIKSAKKRVKVNAKKYSQNRSAKSELSTAIKKFRTVVATANLEEAERLFPTTVSLIDSAASKGVIHKNNASGKVSSISLLMRDLRAGKITAPVVEPKQTKAKKKTQEPKAPKAEAKQEAPAKKEKKTEKKPETKAE